MVDLADILDWFNKNIRDSFDGPVGEETARWEYPEFSTIFLLSAWNHEGFGLIVTVYDFAIGVN